jgi:hypothetical protein
MELSDDTLTLDVMNEKRFAALKALLAARFMARDRCRRLPEALRR